MQLSGYHTLESVAQSLDIEYKALYARVIRGSIQTERLGRVHLIPDKEFDRIKRELKFRKKRNNPPTDRAQFLSKHKRTYSSWRSMMSRCTNNKDGAWKTHGGRGIKVCQRWLKFENFLKDMGERPEGKTLERKDTSGDYTPDNCKWASWSEQNKNRRPWGSVSGRKS